MGTGQVYAKIPFIYGGQQLERGELLRMRGLKRDQQLLGLRYFIPYEETSQQKSTCPDCGKDFAGYAYLMDHKRKPDCKSEPAEPTKADTAFLIDADPDKVIIDG